MKEEYAHAVSSTPLVVDVMCAAGHCQDVVSIAPPNVLPFTILPKPVFDHIHPVGKLQTKITTNLLRAVKIIQSKT